jgi:hypothetical protein
MANLFELLTNAGNKIKTGLQNNAFLNNLTQRTPYIEDSNAEWDKSIALEARKAQDEAQFAQKMQRIQNNPNSLEARMYNFGNNLKDFNLGDALLGKQAAPTDSMSADSNGLKITTSENPRIGGVLRDIAGGYQENRFTPASLENLGQNTLEGGRQKGFAYKLGEGLGSISRLANSPLGRGLIVGGLVTATGGNPLQALAYGGGATMLNQQNVLRDRAYRNDIINSETQRIMNDTSLTNDQKENAIEQLQNQVSAYRGYMTPEVYSNLIRSQQLRDNAAYRKMYFDAQQENQKIANRFREMQYAGQQRQNAIENQFKRESLDIQKEKAQNQGKQAGNIGNLNAVSEQLKRFEGTFKNMPGKLESNTLGRVRAATGFQTKEEANFNSQRTLLFNKIARDLGGEKGVLSDQDIKRIEASLPSYTDSYEQKQAKMAAIYDLLNDRLQVEGATMAQSQETDPLGIL